MEASNANTLVRGLPGMVSNGQVILGNLVVFRQIGIKIPLAIEFTVGGNLAVGGQARQDLLIKHWQDLGKPMHTGSTGLGWVL